MSISIINEVEPLHSSEHTRTMSNSIINEVVPLHSSEHTRTMSNSIINEVVPLHESDKENQSFHHAALLTELLKLSDEEQLDIIIRQSQHLHRYMKWRLKSHLCHEETSEMSDLLSFLPPELQLKILCYLDLKTIHIASQVSKSWHRLIIDQSYLWKKQCVILGVNMDKLSPSVPWYKVYVQSRLYLSSLNKNDTYFQFYINLQNCKEAVKAVSYQDGYLCTVSEEDVVNIWQLQLNIAILTFRVDRAVSCITFKPGLKLVCGHFTGILSSWDLSIMKEKSSITYIHGFEGENIGSLECNKFKLHSGPVFTCDYCLKHDLLISGGADICIKFWQLSTGLLLKSIPQQSNWILTIKFYPSTQSSLPHILLSMTRDDVHKFTWEPSSSSSINIDEEDEKCKEEKNDRNCLIGNIDQLNCKLCVKLNNVNSYFTPQLPVSSKYAALINHDLDEKYSNLNIYDINKFDLIYSSPLRFKVKKLLAIGNRFALILSPGKELFSSALYIVDIQTGLVVGSCTIPHSKMTTPDGAQIVVGDTDWLDGLCTNTEWSNESSCQNDQDNINTNNLVDHDIHGTSSSAKLSSHATPSDKTPGATAASIHSLSRAAAESTQSPSRAAAAALIGDLDYLSSISSNLLKLDDDDFPSDIDDDDSHDTSLYNRSVRCKNYFQRDISENPIPPKYTRRHKPCGKLILAAGLKSKPGRLFTLWWSNDGLVEYDQSYKTE